jgi:hypothetical protein
MNDNKTKIKYLNLYLDDDDEESVWGCLHYTEKDAQESVSEYLKPLLIAYRLKIK